MSVIVVLAAVSIGIPLDVASLWMSTMSFYESIQKKGETMNMIGAGWDGARGTASHLLCTVDDDGRAHV